MNKSTEQNSRQTDGGSFGTGLFLGIIGGGLGMFLFGTKRGRVVLQELKKELAINTEELLENENVKKALPALEETKNQVEKAVGTWKNTFPKFQKKH
jgi:hypothetical protein